jgi:hypothetical protein
MLLGLDKRWGFSPRIFVGYGAPFSPRFAIRPNKQPPHVVVRYAMQA